jgi:hypothetical protein
MARANQLLTTNESHVPSFLQIDRPRQTTSNDKNVPQVEARAALARASSSEAFTARCLKPPAPLFFDNLSS